MEILGRRCRQLFDDLKETRRYCRTKGEAIDRSVCITRIVSDCRLDKDSLQNDREDM